MIWTEQLRKDVLSDADENKERQGEQDSSYRNPGHTKTDQEIDELEDGKYGYVFEWNWFHKGSMNPLQDPVKSECQAQW